MAHANHYQHMHPHGHPSMHPMAHHHGPVHHGHPHPSHSMHHPMHPAQNHHAHHHPQQHNNHHHHNSNHHNNNNHHYHSQTQTSNQQQGKQLMSFQNYVRTLSNNVDETTAYKRYKDFMANLSQSKVGRFFESNKDREWFKLRYHPIESQKTLRAQNANFLKRLKIFNDLNAKNYFHTLSYNHSNVTSIVNFMDAISIQLDDGPQELVDQLLANNTTENAELRQQYIPNQPTSIVMDDIDIDTTISEIQELCIQANPDLIRIAQLDPYYTPDGNIRRKVVVVYKSNVDIRNVCWKLSRMKLNNRPTRVSINKCLTNRVHSTDAAYNHCLCLINAIRNSILLILNFDQLRGLYGDRKQLLEISPESLPMDADIKMADSSTENQAGDGPDAIAPVSPPGSDKSANDEEGAKPFDVGTLDEEKEKEKRKLLEFKFTTDLSCHEQATKLTNSKNPLLEKAHIYLVEFADSTQALHQLADVPKQLRGDENIDLDKMLDDKLQVIKLIAENLPYSTDEITRYLDQLLWYLRIVHSFDYYKKAIYRFEDELTLRMSVIHLRGDPNNLVDDIDLDTIKELIFKDDKDLVEFAKSQCQKYVTKDEERFNYKTYGKVITDELASYAQRIQKPKSSETEEVYKCKHCSRVFQKLSDIGRHFVGKHRWAVDAIELETDFFNAYLFDAAKMDPTRPKDPLDIPPNRFAKLTNLSQLGEDPDLLQQTIEAYNKLDSFVREPAPRVKVEDDPRNESLVDYADISFDDAI